MYYVADMIWIVKMEAFVGCDQETFLSFFPSSSRGKKNQVSNSPYLPAYSLSMLMDISTIIMVGLLIHPQIPL